MTIRSTALALLAATSLIGFSAPTFAEVMTFHADLTGAAEVPANEATGTGMVEANYDTDTMNFDWTVTYDGLTGDAAAAHFHGPAAEGENAAPVIPIKGELASPTKGEATLTEDQASQLQDGKWYFNIHTAAHPDGELRGQVMSAAK